jgi:hypothetical protein
VEKAEAAEATNLKEEKRNEMMMQWWWTVMT